MNSFDHRFRQTVCLLKLKYIGLIDNTPFSLCTNKEIIALIKLKELLYSVAKFVHLIHLIILLIISINNNFIAIEKSSYMTLKLLHNAFFLL